MTPVSFQFVLPTGEPLANAQVDVQLAHSSYNDHASGITVPRLISVMTDANGRAVLELWPSTTLYYVTVQDPNSDAGLNYKFLVPEVPDGTTVQLQDLVIDAPMSGTTYDDAALLVIQDSKANSHASAIAAAASAAQAAASAVNVGQYFAEVDAARVAAANSQASAATSATAAAGSATGAAASAVTAGQQAAAAASSAANAATAVSNAVAQASSDAAAVRTAAAASADAAQKSQADASAAAIAASAASSSAAGSAAAAAASAVAAAANVGSAVPYKLSAAHAVGDTITVSMNPGWTVSGYQWMRNGAPIDGATDSSYLIDPADGGCLVELKVINLTYSPTGISVPAYVSLAWDDSGTFNDTNTWED